MTADELIAQYIRLRDHIDKRSKEHAEELAPYSAALETIENACAALLLAQAGPEGKANIATPSGTVYRKKWTAIKVVSRPDWMNFVASDWQNHNVFLTAAVAKKELEEWIDINKMKPPGTDISSGYSTLFNRPKG